MEHYAVAFALLKSDTHSKETASKNAKRSPLAGLLSKKKKNNSDDELPQLDVAGGVSRALRSSVKNAEQVAEAAHQTEKHPVREALGAIEGALYAIDRIRDTLEQACEVAISAKDVKDVGGRALLAERYDELRLSIAKIITEADPRAIVLIGGGNRHLDVHLGGKTRYSVSPMRLDINEGGLALSPPSDAFATFEEIEHTFKELDGALAKADRAAAGYCRDAQYLIARMNGAFEG
ncbi:MAG: hypothetical protein DHS20C05_18570 [Hyphococcus sp.]|nr:MAG: hypothetical protein DHS20C05_18570 [Marinicaulis sp.]